MLPLVTTEPLDHGSQSHGLILGKSLGWVQEERTGLPVGLQQTLHNRDRVANRLATGGGCRHQHVFSIEGRFNGLSLMGAQSMYPLLTQNLNQLRRHVGRKFTLTALSLGGLVPVHYALAPTGFGLERRDNAFHGILPGLLPARGGSCCIHWLEFRALGAIACNHRFTPAFTPPGNPEVDTVRFLLGFPKSTALMPEIASPEDPQSLKRASSAPCRPLFAGTARTPWSVTSTDPAPGRKPTVNLRSSPSRLVKETSRDLSRGSACP